MAVHVHSLTPEGSTDTYSIKDDGQAFLCELYCHLFKKGLTSTQTKHIYLFMYVFIYLLVMIHL